MSCKGYFVNRNFCPIWHVCLKAVWHPVITYLSEWAPKHIYAQEQFPKCWKEIEIVTKLYLASAFYGEASFWIGFEFVFENFHLNRVFLLVHAMQSLGQSSAPELICIFHVKFKISSNSIEYFHYRSVLETLMILISEFLGLKSWCEHNSLKRFADIWWQWKWFW